MANIINIKERVMIKFKINVKTGLHIGGNKETFGIGGIDSPVIKDPITNEPIIPGSSLKGKMRMLITNVLQKGIEEEITKKLFGSSQTKNKENDYGITRIIFRDMFLTAESKDNLQKHLGKNFFTEVKAENKIDHIKCQANPRFIERVPAGAVFEGECIVNILEQDDKNELINLIKQGFELVNNNTLGGSGSRGYGKVEIVVEEEIILGE